MDAVGSATQSVLPHPHLFVALPSLFSPPILAHFFSDTNLLVKLSEGGDVADLEVNHQLDSKTAIKVEAQLQSAGAQVEIEREVDSENSIRPRFDIKSKHLTCAWVRKLSRDRTATLTIDPDNSVEFELETEVSPLV